MDLSIKPEPDWPVYKERELLLNQTAHLEEKLPPGFPCEIRSKAVWSPRELDLADITLVLNSTDIDELEKALKGFQATNGTFNGISPTTFKLPLLGPRLRKISRDLHFGRGVAIVSGLDPDRYTTEENIGIFAGLASYIGNKRGTQSAEKHVLSHLVEARNVPDPRPNLTNSKLPFHNDSGEILGLYVVQPARNGGRTLFASAAQVYNEITRTKPYLIDILAKPNWPHETCRSPVEQRDYPLLFKDENGNPYFAFTRYALTGYQSKARSGSLPPLTMMQEDALDTIQFTAAANCLAFPQRKGDIHLLSNRANLHAREAYVNEDDAPPRHLMRLALEDSEYGNRIPDILNVRWGHMFSHSLEQGKWVFEKSPTDVFASAKKFDGLYLDESSHSTG